MQGIEYDIAYGLHSNIPACCIVFFVTDWQREHMRPNSPYARAVHSDLIQYVPCPECFALCRFNGIRKCERDCGRRCYKEFGEREATPLERMQIESVLSMCEDRD